MGSHGAMKGKSLIEKFRTSSMIKEAFDNLPSGVCYFDGIGCTVLVNKVMHKLAFDLIKSDIQYISDLDGIMKDSSMVISGDGTVWQFIRRELDGYGGLTEIIAADITELYHRRQELEAGNAEYRRTMRRLERISEDIASITRNEEILAMKMRIHNDLGYALGAARRFIASGCDAEEKAEYISNQREMAKKLLGEIGNDDEPDIFSELRQSAEKLGMEIVFDGELPDFAEELMTKAIRECLINTVRHAGGDKVFVKAERSGDKCTFLITNNGNPPAYGITEGGGLSALRRSVEESGGEMKVDSGPVFAVVITLTEKKGEAYD